MRFTTRESLLEKRIASGWSSRRALRPRSFGALPSQLFIVNRTITPWFAFKAHLADYRLPDEVIEAYATTFSHNGEFLLLKTESKRVETALEILRNAGATRVARHD